MGNTLTIRKIKKIGELAQHMMLMPSSIKYLGYLGYYNLGDEALFESCRQAFQPTRLLNSRRPASPKWLGNIYDSRCAKGVILGGGTLIGGGYTAGHNTNPILHQLNRSISETGFGAVFGTGVADPSFWSNKKNGFNWLETWKPILKRCTHVGVRGPMSAEILRRIDISAQVIGDPVCMLVQPKEFWKPTKRSIGINVSVKGLCWGNKDSLLSEYADFIRRCVRAKWQIEYFTVSPKDVETAKELAEQSGTQSSRIHNIYTNSSRYLLHVSRMRIFVGVKLHAVILALCAGVPSIMIKYNPKGQDFMDSVGAHRFVVNTEKANASRLMRMFEELVESGPEVVENIQTRMFEYKEAQYDFAKEIDAGWQKVRNNDKNI